MPRGLLLVKVQHSLYIQNADSLVDLGGIAPDNHQRTPAAHALGIGMCIGSRHPRILQERAWLCGVDQMSMPSLERPACSRRVAAALACCAFWKKAAMVLVIGSISCQAVQRRSRLQTAKPRMLAGRLYGNAHAVACSSWAGGNRPARSARLPIYHTTPDCTYRLVQEVFQPGHRLDHVECASSLLKI